MIRIFMTCLAIYLSAVGNIFAADNYLLGDWAGLKPAMQQKGITASAVLTTDFLYNTHGGVKRDGTMLGNMDLTFKADTAKAGWWQDGTLFFYFLGNFGSNTPMTEIVGDIQTSSNIEAIHAVKLYEAWYEHRFNDGRISILAGLHDFNSEFDVLKYASLFINSSFGISPDISQVGPSIFSTTALGSRLKVQPTETSYLMAALYDGVPGDPGHPKRTAINLRKDDGVFIAGEAGLSAGEPGGKEYFKIGAGAWQHTAKVDSFDGQQNDDNHGFYFIAEKALFAGNGEGQGLGGFVQFGWADANWNQIARYWGVGLNYTGLITGRDRDSIGLAVANSRNGGKFMEYSKNVELAPVDRAETAIELTYRAELRSWLSIQPDFQYIINPGMNQSLKNAFQVGSRVEIIF